MKKIISILCALTLLFVLSGCNQQKNMGRLRSMEYNFASDMGSTKYSLTPDKDKNLRFQVENNGKLLYSNPIALFETDIEELEQILSDNNIASWNGFQKQAKGVSDGFSFSVNIQYNNGSVTASGYQMFPENFQNTHKQVVEFFEKMQSAYSA